MNLSNNLTISGKSVAADHTGFVIPERGIYFDAGVILNKQPSLIAITHGHSDHTFLLPKIMNSNINKKVVILVPEKCGKYIRNYVNSYYQLNMCTNRINMNKMMDIIELSQGDKYDIKIDNIDYIFDIIKCHHSVPTIGYLLSRKRKKLAEEFRELKQEEIKQLVKQGVKVNCFEIEKIFAYICDSSILVLERNPNIFEYKVIMIECTFLDLKDIKMAKKKRHIHWTDLEKYVEAYPNIRFILFHFSGKYKKEYIVDFFKDKPVEYFC